MANVSTQNVTRNDTNTSLYVPSNESNSTNTTEQQNVTNFSPSPSSDYTVNASNATHKAAPSPSRARPSNASNASNATSQIAPAPSNVTAHNESTNVTDALSATPSATPSAASPSPIHESDPTSAGADSAFSPSSWHTELVPSATPSSFEPVPVTSVDQDSLFNGMLFPFAIFGCLVLLGGVLALYALVIKKLPRARGGRRGRKKKTKFHKIMDDADQAEVELCARGDDYGDDYSEDDEENSDVSERRRQSDTADMRMNVLSSMM